jgi:hypothetical protein
MVMATHLQVRDLITAQPFRPFHVRMVSGRTFEVRHPENIACSPNGRDMVVYSGDELIHVEASLVETLEPIPAAKTAEGNGA